MQLICFEIFLRLQSQCCTSGSHKYFVSLFNVSLTIIKPVYSKIKVHRVVYIAKQNMVSCLKEFAICKRKKDIKPTAIGKRRSVVKVDSYAPVG